MCTCLCQSINCVLGGLVKQVPSLMEGKINCSTFPLTPTPTPFFGRQCKPEAWQDGGREDNAGGHEESSSRKQNGGAKGKG